MDNTGNLGLVGLVIATILNSRLIMVLIQYIIVELPDQHQVTELIDTVALLWVNLQTALHKFAYLGIDFTPDRFAEVKDCVLKSLVFNYPIHDSTCN